MAGIEVRVDWDKSGDYTTFGDNVSALVLSRSPVNFRYGRDQDTALAPVASASGSMLLNNRDRRFSPRNTASPLYGKVKPGRPVKITREVSGTTYTLLDGITDDSPILPALQDRSVQVTLVDALAGFAGANVTVPLTRDIRTGTAVGLILDKLGWTGGRDLDSGATVIPWFWLDRADARSALDDIVSSEGAPALLTVGVDGGIVFRDRHHRLTRAASLTSQVTLRNKGVEPVFLADGFTYEESWRNVINTGATNVDVRRPAGEQAVWTSDATITLTAGEQKVITASASDPFFNALVPQVGVDFTMSAGSVSVALLNTSGSSAGIVLTAVGGVAIVNNLQLRANPVTVAHAVQVSASDSASMDDYDPRSFPGELPWCGPEDAESILRTAVAQRARPLATATVRFMLGNNLTRAAKILALDLSDRVTVYEDETFLNGVEFYVESITHEFSGTHDHTVTLGLEAVPTPVSPVFRFDTTGQGFDQGRFGSDLTDSTNMFRFDTAGQGFDQGFFAA